MNPSIRSATGHDEDALFALVRDFATSFVPERSAFACALREILTDAAANLSVAIIEGEIVGYCLGFDHYAFYANGRVAWVEEIFVKEEYRAGGIGRALMASFEAWGVSRDARLVGLATRRAASFYRAIGYEESAVFFRKVL